LKVKSSFQNRSIPGSRCISRVAIRLALKAINLMLEKLRVNTQQT
jgi:hypothetical protein